MLAMGDDRLEHVEQFVQHAAHIAAVNRGVIVDRLKENVLRLENAGVVGEKAEKQPDKQLLQIVSDVSWVAERERG